MRDRSRGAKSGPQRGKLMILEKRIEGMLLPPGTGRSDPSRVRDEMRTRFQDIIATNLRRAIRELVALPFAALREQVAMLTS